MLRIVPRKRSRHPLLEHSQKQLHQEKYIEFRTNDLFAFIHVYKFQFQSLTGVNPLLDRDAEAARASRKAPADAIVEVQRYL